LHYINKDIFTPSYLYFLLSLYYYYGGLKFGELLFTSPSTLPMTLFPEALTGSISGLQVYPHPPAPSPRTGEGEPDSKSLSQSGRGT
jgi:hypothetical protein